MKIFVTGATGFLGSRVARKLLDADHGVCALVRDPARASDLAARGAELVQGDIRDPAGVAAAMEGADAVIHMAAWYKVGSNDADAAQAINVDGTRNVLEAAQELKIPRCVYTSTIAIFGNTLGRVVTEADAPVSPPATLYEATKRRAHHEVLRPLARAGLPVVALLPGVIYGPRDRSPVADSVRLWLQGRLPSLPSSATFSWAHVDDVADAHVAALTRGRVGEDYLLAGPIHSLTEVFELAASVAGRPAPRLKMPPLALKIMARLAAPVAKHLPPTFHPETLRSAAGVTIVGRSDKAHEELGFTPRTLRDGYPEYVRWQMNELGLPPPA